MQKDFTPNSVEQNTQILADYLPQGVLYRAKNIDGSKLRTLLQALSLEYTRIQGKIEELSEQYYMPQTTNLLEAWERVLGIPDDCFTNTVSVKDRRLQIVAKFALMNVTTTEDWIYLASFLGYNISIEYGTPYMVLPFKLPFILGSEKAAKFTMIINFLDLPPPTNVFPLTLPFMLGNISMIQCVFEHIKPANVKIIYRYLG